MNKYTEEERQSIMKKYALLVGTVVVALAVTFVASLNVLNDAFLFAAPEINRYYHFSEVSPTANEKGIREYWTDASCRNPVFEKPEGVNLIVDKTLSSAQIAEIRAIENDERLSLSFNEFDTLYNGNELVFPYEFDAYKKASEEYAKYGATARGNYSNAEVFEDRSDFALDNYVSVISASTNPVVVKHGNIDVVEAVDNVDSEFDTIYHAHSKVQGTDGWKEFEIALGDVDWTNVDKVVFFVKDAVSMNSVRLKDNYENNDTSYIVTSTQLTVFNTYYDYNGWKGYAFDAAALSTYNFTASDAAVEAGYNKTITVRLNGSWASDFYFTGLFGLKLNSNRVVASPQYNSFVSTSLSSNFSIHTRVISNLFCDSSTPDLTATKFSTYEVTTTLPDDAKISTGFIADMNPELNKTYTNPYMYIYTSTDITFPHKWAHNSSFYVAAKEGDSNALKPLYGEENIDVTLTAGWHKLYLNEESFNWFMTMQNTQDSAIYSCFFLPSGLEAGSKIIFSSIFADSRENVDGLDATYTIDQFDIGALKAGKTTNTQIPSSYYDETNAYKLTVTEAATFASTHYVNLKDKTNSQVAADYEEAYIYIYSSVAMQLPKANYTNSVMFCLNRKADDSGNENPVAVYDGETLDLSVGWNKIELNVDVYNTFMQKLNRGSIGKDYIQIGLPTSLAKDTVLMFSPVYAK